MYGNIGFYLISILFYCWPNATTPPPLCDEEGGEAGGGGAYQIKNWKKKKNMYEFYVLSHSLCFYFSQIFYFL